MEERELRRRLAQSLGSGVLKLKALHGGCVASVFKATLKDGRRVAVKYAREPAAFHLEGWMLTELKTRSHLPVPAVLHADDRLLVMSYVEGGGVLDGKGQALAASMLAALHGLAPDKGNGGKARYGYERDTLIGGLRQPNPWSDSWVAFFRDHRLLYMAREAYRYGTLPASRLERIEKLAARLENTLCEPAAPSLLHGDIWSGNIIVRRGRPAAFLDPALYYGADEMELAFITLFSTFDATFFDHYRKTRPIAPGFFEERRDLYNLYPLLTHVRLFGGVYRDSLDATLTRLGV